MSALRESWPLGRALVACELRQARCQLAVSDAVRYYQASPHAPDLHLGLARELKLGPHDHGCAGEVASPHSQKSRIFELGEVHQRPKKPEDTHGLEQNARAIDATAAELRRIVPDAGSYVSESNYFNPEWQKEYWGGNYARLRAVKMKYDPHGLFFVHRGVGSEDWSADGFTQLR